MSVISAIDLKVGYVVSYNNGRYRVLKTQHVKPGKGGAFMQAELKEIQTGQKLNQRFRSDESLDKVQIEERDAQYLYDSGSEYALMLLDDSEQIDVPYSMLSDEERLFLQDEMILNAGFADGELISLSLPRKVICEVAEAEAYIKGQTASGGFKSAVLTNGIRVSVPQYIDSGQKIIFNTETMEYVEKA